MSVPRETFPSKVKDLFLTQEEFSLLPHKKYEGVLCTSPLPSSENLPRYYESEEYISHTDASQSLRDKMYQAVKNINQNQKYKLLKKVKTSGSILDYGCGTGDFLAYMKKKNFTVFGHEPNPNASQIAQTKLPQNALPSWEELDQKNYDVICLWHVLEHLPDLEEKIEWFKNHLNPQGVLFIAVPNFTSYDAQHYQEYWAAYDVPRHLWHFSPSGIKNVFDQFGMKIENINPMYFDSFYVSMLSEKYKRSSMGFLRGGVVGAISNFKALFSGNYSSLIYQITIKSK